MNDNNLAADGCLLKCTMGNGTCKLKVPKSHGAEINGKNQATVMDYKPGCNLSSFGTCRRMTPPQNCVPVVLIPWMIKDKNNQLNGEPVLSESSVLSCVCGGVIHIVKEE
ncbi:DUF4280 domain-containing protein [Clostridium sp. E02]|uniref:DUF4280 domain-containing protein n=1 Tax=Clostridium sp. E02 TaxID=2487134 RepID=UPI0013DDBC78|nr:DUF4280 domain-containing protein [Clostridium sp. E02]